MDDRIRCSVSSCHYWQHGNICGASQIMVTADSIGASKPDSFDAPQASVAPSTPASKCEETCCKTFTMKDSGKTHMDNVHKM
ncbi:MAG: DUF1540 domain-containing protein [Firmicutes bacterium]|jgi:hypothetical protein|nr:DUF1540 domain-containing protein [Bacillota bacterium]